MRTRRGASLIEMLVVISTMSVIMTVAATTILWLLRSEASGAKAVAASAGFSRLATDFRRDVHSATGAEMQPQQEGGVQGLTLRLPLTQRIHYEAQANHIVRKQHVGDQIRSTDTYSLPAGVCRFELVPPDHDKTVAAQEGTVVRLIYSRQLGAAVQHRSRRIAAERGATREYRIEALLRRDHRFEKKSESSGASTP